MHSYLKRLGKLVPGVSTSITRRDTELAHLREELATRDQQLDAALLQLDQWQKELATRDQQLAEAWAHAYELDAALLQLDQWQKSADYNADGLIVHHKNVSFLRDPRFMAAYRRGASSGHKISETFGTGKDIHVEWRVHVACWAAMRAKSLPGAFVECGVNTGIFSLAVCEYIDINAIGKDFYLFDTFNGIPESQMCDEERTERVRENVAIYEECFEVAKRNFAPFPRARLIRGLVPDTLPTAPIDRVCYLSIDMNIVQPEIAAMEYFWDKLVPGGVVILDDYGWKNYHLQMEAHDRFAASKGVSILLLPTAQGLIIKP
jgi:O-methyltransferase